MKRAAWGLSLLLIACDGGASATESAKHGKADNAESASEKSATKDAPAKAEVAEDAAAKPEVAAGEGPVLDHTVKTIDGEDKKLSEYRGKALLVVNTASQCGYTPQYEGLQELHAKYASRGFEVLAFPSNDFGAQEPGSHEEIKSFVDDKYGVQFPMFAKVPVKGDAKVPLYKTLTEDTPEGIRGEIKWNFTKFLVDPKGQVIARYESNVDPMDDDLTAKLESVLPSG